MRQDRPSWNTSAALIHHLKTPSQQRIVGARNDPNCTVSLSHTTNQPYYARPPHPHPQMRRWDRCGHLVGLQDLCTLWCSSEVKTHPRQCFQVRHALSGWLWVVLWWTEPKTRTKTTGSAIANLRGTPQNPDPHPSPNTPRQTPVTPE